MLIFLAFLLVPPAYLIHRYNETIKNRIQNIESNFTEVKVYREKVISTNPHIKCLELSQKFVEKHSGACKMMSLGQYLSSLRYTSEDENTESFLKKQLEATIGKLLLNYLGKTYGSALLPMVVGSGTSVDQYLNDFAAKMAMWVSSKMISNKHQHNIVQSNSDSNDHEQHPLNLTGQAEEEIATFPLSLSELISLMNINQTLIGSGKLSTSPLDMLQRGEIDQYEHAFEEIIPNPFILERDFEKAIQTMEDQIRESNPSYDPDDKSVSEPVPINERLLPDLYLGTGSACNSHTQRESLVNRLTAILLNKLSYNFYKQEQNEKDLFEVRYNDESCVYPDEFVQALIHNGHEVDACPRSQITSFGLSLCVKEEDEAWINIPIAIMMRSGYERYQDNRPVTFAAPHGGLDFNITGPLIGTTNTCTLQYYVAYRGLCAFHPDQDIVLPWKKKADLATPYSDWKAVRAARMAGLVSVAYSKIGTEMNLPFGGYGVLGVCNDISGIVDFAVNGETSVYPLSSTGRYLSHFIRYMMELQGILKEKIGMERAVDDIQKLIHAVANIDNDLHASPSKAKDSAKKYSKAHPEIYFQETAESLQVMNEISEMYDSLSVWNRVSK